MMVLQRCKVATVILALMMAPSTLSFAPLIQTPVSSSSSSPLSHRHFPNAPRTSERSIRHSKTTVAHLFPTSMVVFVNSYSSVAFASLSATAKLLSSIGLGSVAAKIPNLLDAAAISSLSRLTYWVFQPAFLFCSVSSTLGNSSNASGGMAKALLWMLPLTAMLQVASGALVAKFLTRNMEEAEARDVTMCTTFGNSGPLPLIFVDALVKGKLQSDVAACISFYLLSWSPLFWSYGKVILGTNVDDTSSTESSGGLSGVVQTIRKFLTPPLMGSILGFLVGSIPLLQQLFMGGLASPLFGACNSLGSVYVPAALLVLAGSLVQSFSAPPQVTSSTGATVLPPPDVSRRALGAILLSRFCLAPIFSLGTFRVMDHFQVLGNGRSRAIVSFVILMQGCMPSAQNSVVILQLAGLKERAGRMAKTLAILYSMSVIPVTILLSACLALSGILKYN